MMIHPTTFIEEHKKDTYEELINVRNELYNDIISLEKEILGQDTAHSNIAPSADVMYQMNLQYLSALSTYMADRFREERDTDGEW